MSCWYGFHKNGGRREKEKNRRPSVPFATLLFFSRVGEASPPAQSGAPRTGLQASGSIAIVFEGFFFFDGSCLTIIVIRHFWIWVVAHIYSFLGRRWLLTGLLGEWAEKKIP